MVSRRPKSKMCHYGLECPFVNCKFVHHEDELRRWPTPPGFERKPCKFGFQFQCPRRHTCWNEHQGYPAAPSTQPIISNPSVSKMCNNGPECTFVNCKYVHYEHELRRRPLPPDFEQKCPRRNTCWNKHQEYPAAPSTQPIISNPSVSKMCNNGPECTFVNCKYVHYEHELRRRPLPPDFEQKWPRRNTYWNKHQEYPAAPSTQPIISNPTGQPSIEAKHEAPVPPEESKHEEPDQKEMDADLGWIVNFLTED